MNTKISDRDPYPWNKCRICGEPTKYTDKDGRVCPGTRTLLHIEGIAKKVAARLLTYRHSHHLPELSTESVYHFLHNESERWLKKRIADIEKEDGLLIDCRERSTIERGNEI